MLFKTLVIFYGILICADNKDASASNYEADGQIPEEQSLNLKEDANTSMELVPLDSHEAMNNREVNSKLPKNGREKRSYEFLIGLVNNNSKYEVTRVDPSTTVNPEAPEPRNTSASEALLELMVKIASHPEQWDRVHKLLRNIDEDLQVSKTIVDDIQENKELAQNKQNHKRQYSQDSLESKETVYGSILHDPDEYKSARIFKGDEKGVGHKNLTENKPKVNNWPEFKEDDQQYGSIRTNYAQDYIDENMSQLKYQPQPLTGNRNRHRQFEYRVVTDRPFVHSKTPKAYIAVSLIAPKPMESQENDFLLESELRQLKPWALQQDYQDVDNLQGRWVKKSQQRVDRNRSP